MTSRGTLFSGIRESVLEELGAMQSGHFIPYHKLAFLASLVTTVVMSLIFSQMGVIEAPVSVVDLDRTAASARMITAADSSRDIRVAEVIRGPADPAALTRHDRTVGVLVIPEGFEKALLRGERTTVGYMADQTNAAQNGEVFSALGEIAAEMGASVSSSSLESLGRPGTGSAGPGVSVSTRRLFVPGNDPVPITVAGFLYFFSGIYLGLTTLMLTGRMHVSGEWRRAILERGPVAMASRLIPYVLAYAGAVTFMTAMLVLFNAFPFKGNYLAYLPSLLLLPFAIGLIAMVVTWNFPTPAGGAAFMIFIVPPGFIMGGMTLATGELPGWAWVLSHAFPLTWQFAMYRDFGLRGTGLAEMAAPYGAYVLYVGALLALFLLRFYSERRKMLRAAPGVTKY